MYNLSISITPKNTIKYPLHQHENWEIMYYLSGSGYLATRDEKIPFQKGSILLVPPRTIHGSVSQEGFVNISVGGDFSHLFMHGKLVRLQDNPSAEGEVLAKLLLKNRYADANYVAALCSAYLHFLLQNMDRDSQIEQSVAAIIFEITKQFSDPDLCLTALLTQSGYAEDYIRAVFKRITSLTPVQFLTKVRMEHAQKLFEIYGKSITVAEAAQTCGFKDVIYFSKRFKQWYGVSPDAYRKEKRKQP